MTSQDSQHIGAGKTVAIIGAGLAGSLLAVYLARLGFVVSIYERRSDPRAAGYSGGRSINLALSARGLWGLEGVGLDQQVLKHALPMRGRMMHPADPGRPVYFQPYSSNTADSIKSISRAGLNLAILEAAAAEPNVSLHFQQRCVDIDLDRCAAIFQSEPDPGPTTEVSADVILGADGAFSAVRARLQKTDRFEYSQSFLTHGYKELHIPVRSDGGFALDPSALHIWPRGRAMMIALPNPDQTFTCTLFWPFEGEHSFAALRTPAEVLSFFHRHYPDAVPIMPTLETDFFSNPTGSLTTVRCWPWVHTTTGGKAVAVLGDAAHAIVPFFGQGMNAAFEDVRILRDCLVRSAPRGGGAGVGMSDGKWIAGALDDFQRLRKPNTDAIARMALDNFVEMRDRVGSRLFVQRKKTEHALHAAFPEFLAPKYNLVSFSTVPYTEALRRGARIDRAIRFLYLLAALIFSGILSLFGFPAWLVVVAAILAAWLIWDRMSFRRDTSV